MQRTRVRRCWHSVLPTGIALLCTACASVQTTQPGAIGVDRTQRMLVSESEVEAGAVQAYAKELDKARQKGALDSDKVLLQRVRQIAARLTPETRVFRADAPAWNWEVNVESSKEVNAYCMPGGKIMVYSGLVDQLKLTDDELAAVIGHEMAHALREHTRERVSRAYAQQLVLSGVAVLTGAGQGAVGLASQVADVTFMLPHSREQESEADEIGLELMARAGYDPRAAVSVWQKMARLTGQGGPGFLSTHPSSSARMKDLQKKVPVVMPLYQAALRKR